MDKKLREALLSTWRTGNRIMIFLIEHISDELWEEKVPGYARKTIQMIGGHLHNTRCMWIEKLGKKHGIAPPGRVDRYKVTRKELIYALEKSSDAMLNVLEKGLDLGGKIVGFPPDIVHFLNYMMAHEAHHRGQITMAAKQLDRPLPEEVTYGLWHWSKRAKEAT